jgi:hypothetical protein
MLQAPMNSVKHHCHLLQNLTVRETQDTQTAVFQELRSFSIKASCFRFEVLTAINFDHESGCRAVEIQNVRAEWMLSAELQPHHHVSTQVPPEPRLGVC